MRWIVVAIAACGGGSGAPGDGSATRPDGPLPSGATIFTIVNENHDYNEIVGSPNAPYLNSLIAMGGLATNYKDAIHPSTGNYTDLISGNPQYPGVVDVPPNFPPYFPAEKQHLGSQMQLAQIPWRAYLESMGNPCTTTDAGLYAVRHNPFVYFFDIATDPTVCASVDVDYANFAPDLAANATRFMWITPNLDDDGHDPQTDPVTGLMQTDAWMSTHVPPILASAGYQNGGVLFITWDEAEGRNGDDPDQIPMIVLSPRIAPGSTDGAGLTHNSYTATVEDLLGMPRLDAVGSDEPTLLELFDH